MPYLKEKKIKQKSGIAEKLPYLSGYCIPALANHSMIEL
jgi:hypothetical protein